MINTLKILKKNTFKKYIQYRIYYKKNLYLKIN